MLRSIRRVAAPGCLALAAVTAGCGGDQAPSKADYVKQADKICQDARTRQRALGTPTTAKDIVDLATRTKPIVQDEVRRLRALPTPEAFKDTTTTTYDLLDQQLPKIDELVVAAKANDLKRLQSIAQSAVDLNRQATATARQIGLKVCGQG